MKLILKVFILLWLVVAFLETGAAAAAAFIMFILNLIIYITTRKRL